MPDLQWNLLNLYLSNDGKDIVAFLGLKVEMRFPLYIVN